MDNFALALRDLKTFNRMVAAHPELSKRLIHGPYDFLQWRQGQLYVLFRARYRAEADAETPTRAPIKTFLSGLAACVVTLWAVFVRHRPDIAVFSVDSTSAGKDHDFRLDGLYQFLKERHLSFTEIFHTLLGKSMFRNARSRGRSAVYREAFTFLASRWPSRARAAHARLVASLPCETFPEADRAFVRTLIEQMLNSMDVSLRTIRCYRFVLRRLRPRAVWSIDDTRYYQELCAATRAERIPFYAFQHGIFTKYHAGWLASGPERGHDPRPDALFVWSPFWKDVLLRLGTNFQSDEIRIGGNPKGSAFAPVLQATPYVPPSDTDTITVLLPFESDPPLEELKPLLQILLATGRVKFIFKMRPDWDRDVQVRRYGLETAPPDRLETVTNYAPVMDRVHAVLGVHSTLLYDVIPFQRPVFILKTSMEYGEGMVTNGMAAMFDAREPRPAERLSALCRETAPKLAEYVERYQGGTGRLPDTLASLL